MASIVARAADAGNLLSSGHFDEPEDVAAWTVTLAAGEGAMSFQPTPDESDCERSGSALLITRSAGERDVEYSTCTGGIVGGEMYAVGLELAFPDGESAGSLFWGVTWFGDAECAGPWLRSSWVGPAVYAPDWQTLELWESAPLEALGVKVKIWVSSHDASTSLSLDVDRVFAQPVSDLFADGFELGDSCRWDEAP